MKSFDYGRLVRVKATFTNTAGVATDPSTTTLRVQNPAGSVTSYTNASGLTTGGTGIWYRDIDTTASTPGTWQFRWEATGAVVDVREGSFRVRTRLVPAS